MAFRVVDKYYQTTRLQIPGNKMRFSSILVVAQLLLLVSAITVSAIMASFSYRLRHQAFRVPWAFFFVSVKTLAIRW